VSCKTVPTNHCSPIVSRCSRDAQPPNNKKEIDVPLRRKSVRLANITALLRILRNRMVQTINVRLALLRLQVAAQDRPAARQVRHDVARRLPAAGQRRARHPGEVAARLGARDPNLELGGIVGLPLRERPLERRRRRRGWRGVRVAEVLELELSRRRRRDGGLLGVGSAVARVQRCGEGDAQAEVLEQPHRCLFSGESN
jgi:hypothetical protein